MHGKGKKKYASGDTHEGEWVNGKLVRSYVHRNQKEKWYLKHKINNCSVLPLDKFIMYHKYMYIYIYYICSLN